jgi:N-acetylglutamate synthase-like GNAT family acetyltransferase
MKYVFLLKISTEVSRQTGIYAVYVDAIDEQAKSYYKKRGFTEFEDNNLSLFLPIKTIRQAIEQSQGSQNPDA